MRQASYFDFKVLSAKEANDQKEILEKEGWQFYYCDLMAGKVHYKRPNDKYKVKQTEYKLKSKCIKKTVEEVKKVEKKEHKKIEWWKDNFKNL